jgi:hypothetical protein
MKGMGMAKAAMLKELSKEMSNDANSGLRDSLGKKGMKKVTVASDSSEGLKKGLSMAEKLMKLKGGSSEDDMEECEAPEGSKEEEDSSEEMSESESPMKEHAEQMSEEDAMAMYEMLKKRFEE